MIVDLGTLTAFGQAAQMKSTQDFSCNTSSAATLRAVYHQIQDAFHLGKVSRSKFSVDAVLDPKT
ncbi:hypothetical protein N7495_007587 [Penicillium taxi]|uniref:uncharacterized protein n=1 Tax=Penicillium taxi TaxID=168475 RepID=UPI0025450413|nr:uncharacterized protein N7495_007587 [Penicillium taxi]KAJ5887546.1 hypothetical protein N7495_007587 [Penicillium taxi]